MIDGSSTLAAGSGPYASGGLRLTFAGADVVCLPGGGLWLGAEDAMIVADLHLEKGSFYARNGQMLPPYDTNDTLARLAADIIAFSPRMLVFLGDSFHDRAAQARMTKGQHDHIVALSADRAVVWVTGNHDRAGPRDLPGVCLATLTLGGLRFVHEPSGEAAMGEVAGHLHPCARVQARGCSVRRRCFVTDGRRMILPAFGAFAGGLNILEPAFELLLGRRPLAGVLGEGKVHAVGWRSLKPD